MASWLSYFFSSPTTESNVEAKSSVEDFEIQAGKALGSGADSTVVPAIHKPSGKRVALKVIDKSKRRPDQLDRSRFEAKLISTVFDHPNIVKGLPVAEDDKLLLLPMEIASCGDLLDLVNTRRGFPEAEARMIFRQIIEGLAHAHDKGVLHGDIKLENVVIFPPPREKAKLGDFTNRYALCDWGYARYNKGEYIKKAFGSLLYSAPETILGTGQFSTATDIWGTGVVLYSLVYAVLPFPPGKDTKIDIANARYTFWPNVNVSPECKNLISSILRVEPSRRLTLDEIRQHPWLQGGSMPQIPKLLSVPSALSSSPPLSSASSSASNSPHISASKESRPAPTDKQELRSSPLLAPHARLFVGVDDGLADIAPWSQKFVL